MSIFKMLKNRKQSGFTLLEVLLVVAIIAILAGIVIIAINPGKNLGDSRNSQRSADVNTIINAVYQYSLDNNGALPPNGTGVAIGTTATEICATGASSCANLIDLSPLTTGGKYLVAMPKDPQCGTGTVCVANGTGYKIAKDANGRLIVTAPAAENKTISVTK
ncbi:MAG TPA: type II secretion system protein [Candidatus Saccharimonadales bacterium]|nr:type II secretion system protein [Candidatus Saccharimonadales bacterium]